MIAASLALPAREGPRRPRRLRRRLRRQGGADGPDPGRPRRAPHGQARADRPHPRGVHPYEHQAPPHADTHAHAADARRDDLLAVTSRAVADAGAYVSQTGPVVFRSAVTASGPYEVDPRSGPTPTGSTRTATRAAPSEASAAPRSSFACEVQMDEIARALGLDPVGAPPAQRLRPGQRTGTGQVLGEGVGYLGTLEAAAEGLERMRAEFGSADQEPGKTNRLRPGELVQERRHRHRSFRRGRRHSRAHFRAAVFSVRTGAADMGQGSDTVAAQVGRRGPGPAPRLFEVRSPAIPRPAQTGA